MTVILWSNYRIRFFWRKKKKKKKKKKKTRPTSFSRQLAYISIIVQYQKIVLATILKRNNFFKILFQWCKSIHILLLWAKFHWKIPLGKWFFKIWPKSKWREKKIGYLAAILKRNNILIFFLLNCDFYSPYIYGANCIAKYRWESVFFGGFHGTPWAPTGVKVPWSLKC